MQLGERSIEQLKPVGDAFSCLRVRFLARALVVEMAQEDVSEILAMRLSGVS